MASQRILVVDDEPGIRHLVRMYLEQEGFLVDEAADGQDAIARLGPGHNYLLVVLDLMLPLVDGWTICREVRQHSQVPIVMLTARGEEFDRVLGLELGADDYLVKPFSPRELVARVKAVLRRFAGNSQVPATLLHFDGLTIDHRAHLVKVGERVVNLTPREYELLYFLARHPGQVFSREQLLEHVWGYDFFGDLRTVDTHIKKLREKIGDHRWIETVWGVGYKFEVNH